MKKRLILFAITILSLTANAQIKTDAGSFSKPEANDVLMEVSFSPNITGSAGLFSLPLLSQGSDIYVIEARKFTSDTKALRARANISIKQNAPAGGDATTDFTFAIGLGRENHMAGKERLSTYWGYEGALGYNSATPDADIDLEDPTAAAPVKTSTVGFSATLFSGFDYYIVPSVYLGVELNYGLGYKSSTPEGGKATSTLTISPGITPFFRMGWKF